MPAPTSAGLGRYLQMIWLGALLAPAATVYSGGWHHWDFGSASLLMASGATVLGLRLLPGRWTFFVLTAPLVAFGLFSIVAELVRNVDLLDLASQWRTYSATDVESALRPYAAEMALSALIVAALALACCRWCTAPRLRWAAPALMLWIAALTLAQPATLWLRAWPGNALAVAAAGMFRSPALTQYIFPYSENSNPRDPAASWHGSAMPGLAPVVTVVLVIGESVRADYLRECGGPPQTAALTPGALVACDVSSGSDATHTSVPLLISRDMPGLRERVPADATFLQAMHSAGYDSYWLGVQERFIAWPDSRHAVYRTPGIDRKVLLPLLEESLGDPAPRKVVVLHAYNAHLPYCARYETAQAPFRLPCPDQSRLPSHHDERNLLAWRQSYANAVDESVRFLDSVIARLRQLPGEVFLVYTPDHGENLADDARDLYGHAMRTPSRWDIEVPAVFWANDAWRATHAQGWAQLARNTAAQLMHADIVPTLLAAAGVRYDEPRHDVVNLLASTVPARRRIVQQGFGHAVYVQTLFDDASRARLPNVDP
jgi:glucan phosphoethanolaminetransferase (alkaline phosphatase superfamily)